MPMPDSIPTRGKPSMERTIEQRPPTSAALDNGTRTWRRSDLLRADVWRDALLLWLGQRLFLLACTVFGRTVLHPLYVHDVAWFPWVYYWDAKRYSTIATNGYGAQPNLAAFYPLLPALEHGLSVLTGLPAAVAGAVLANLAALVLFALFRLWAEYEAGSRLAQRGLFALAFFPTAFFFAAGYTESIFLALAVGTFLALRARRWALAGALAALAMLCRGFGLLLIVPMGIEGVFLLRAAHWRLSRTELARIGTALAMPLLAQAGFMGYLAIVLGSPLASTSAESAGWGRKLSAPWVGPLTTAHVLLHDPSVAYRFFAALDLLFLLLFVALVVDVWRFLPRVYGVYCAATLALVVLSPETMDPHAVMASGKRYMLAAFPIFLVLARWGTTPARRIVLAALSLLLLALFTLFFVDGIFVA